MPNSSPPTPVRRLISPSTRQYAGRTRFFGGVVKGMGTVLPAGTGAALTISTPGALKLIRLAQESSCCEPAQGTRKNVDAMIAGRRRVFKVPRLDLALQHGDAGGAVDFGDIAHVAEALFAGSFRFEVVLDAVGEVIG